MKLSRYIEVLKEIEAKFGGDLEMVYSVDDEGNYYRSVAYEPTPGIVDDGDFIDIENFEDGEVVSCVCVN